MTCVERGPFALSRWALRATTLIFGAMLLAVPAVARASGIAITGFSPANGAVGTTVLVTGTGFASATGVSFHGVGAPFSADSDTQITARVPSGATTGAITVASASESGASSTAFVVTPIQHVVILYEENHSFDNVLGKLCADATAGTTTVPRAPCNGATTGELSTSTTIPLAPAPDYILQVDHGVGAERTAINGGAMNGWEKLKGCTPSVSYACYVQFYPPEDQANSSIPNISTLAENFTIADHTFYPEYFASWVSHNVLVSATKDNFYGDSPRPSAYHVKGHGQGCDSFEDARWTPPSGGAAILVPSCIPDQTGFGPYRASPVSYVPTIMDRLDAAGLTWKLDAATGSTFQGARTGYSWATCPSFAECLYSEQINNFVPHEQIITDAQQGTLPNLSLVIPTPPISTHNNNSMAMGDNWIGKAVNAVMSGPEWGSTAIFITWDDCGCFYDHMAPPAGSNWSIRAPMIIVSPYAKAGYTDSTPATLSGMLAFVEHTFGLAPLSSMDANAYDFGQSFDYQQTPLTPVRTVRTRLPRSERRYLRAHPAPPDIT